MRPWEPHVLLVEGGTEVRERLAGEIAAEGFAVSQAHGVSDAKLRLEAQAFDALVVEVRHGDGDGLDLIDLALAAQPETLVLALTDAEGAGTAAVAVEHGAAGFLIKPFQVPQLPRLLRAELDSRRLQEENAHLSAELRSRFGFDVSLSRSAGIPEEGINLTRIVSALERDIILRCLEKTGGSKRRAARLLQLSRTTLIDKLHRLNRNAERSAS